MSNEIEELGTQFDGEPIAVEQETPVPEPAPETPEPDAAEEVEAEQALEEIEAKKKKSGVQRLKEKNEALRLRAEQAEAALAASKVVPEPPAKPVSSDRPDPNVYETQAEYLDALTDWKIEQREVARESKAREERAKQEATTRETSWAQKVDEARARIPDLDDLLETPFPLTAAMKDVLFESEIGPDLGVYLVRNQDEAKRIAALSPLAAAREMGKIEARIGAKSEPPPKNTTKAPPPLRSVASSGIVPKSTYHAQFEEF